MRIEIKYHADIKHIESLEQGDWLDLRAAEEVELQAGEHKLISLGVSMRLPEGYEAHLAPRSSTFKNWGLLQPNSPAVIDESYCGDQDIWFYSVYATRDTTVYKNDRICQFRLVKKMAKPEFVEVPYLSSPARGGFGSTGRD